MIGLVRWLITLLTLAASFTQGSENREQDIYKDDLILKENGYVSLTVWEGSPRCRDGRVYLIEPAPKTPQEGLLPAVKSTIIGWEVIFDHLPKGRETIKLGPYDKGTKIVFGFEFRDDCNTSFPHTADRVETTKHSDTLFELKIEDANNYDRDDYHAQIRLDYLENTISDSVTAISAFHNPPVYSKPFCDGKDYKVTAEPGDSNHPGRAFDFGMRKGEPICASEKGIVLWVEDSFGTGANNFLLLSKVNVVVIQTEEGVNQNYLHLLGGSVKEAGIQVGEIVEKGQFIGRAGNSGYVSPITGDGSHLHIEWVQNCYDVQKAKEMRESKYKVGRPTLAWSCPAFPADAPLNFE